MKYFYQPYWSPYVSGVIIGLLQIPSILLLDYTLGLSSAFVTIVKEIYLLFVNYSAPETLGVTNIWQLGLIVGITLGAYLSSKLSRIKRPSIPTVWKNEMNISSKTKRYFMSFIGGICLIVGARLANGCTSGNGISGTAQLNVSSWVVLMTMFVAAVITANVMRILMRRKNVS